MTTKTTINLSPIKRCHGSAYLKKRRLITSINHRKHQQMIMYHNERSMSLPDLLQDIHLEQQRRETIIYTANLLRKVGDQMDEQLQINNTPSIDHRFSHRTITLLSCLSTVLRFFL